MSLEFLNSPCKEQPKTDALFGICDNQDSTKAYTDIEHPEKWIATVKNIHAMEVHFIAVDKCVLTDNEFEGVGRCDGILYTQQHLYFVELKDQASSWITDAIKQLESTIELFRETHNIDDFQHKKAFACNRQHRRFQEIDNETNLIFFRKHKVRLDVQAEVLII